MRTDNRQPEVFRSPQLWPVGRAFKPSPVVIVLERPTPSTAVIDCSDSTSCCYRHQTWRTVRARTHGVCAISGQPITRGDLIYVPAKRSDVRNGQAMILSSIVECETPS
ncbi:DUF3331 domain-containing protein [Paraburkholderia strydomiana]